jgi:DNA-binding response OmpR family regulator
MDLTTLQPRRVTPVMPLKHKILLVEDHEDTSDLMVLILNQLNYDVVTAASIAGALVLAATADFDLFVLDSMLPDGTGTDLCKHIRLRDNSTPILFYSAMAFEHDKDEALSAGAQRYLVKPVDSDVFCRTVTEMLNTSVMV